MDSVLHLERMFYKKTETFIINQINAIKNYKVDVACIKSIYNGNLYRNLIAAPDKHLYLRTKFLRSADKRYMEEKIGERKYSLIHTHFISDAGFFNPITRKMKIPKVASAYGYDVSEFPQRFFGMGEKYLYKVFEDYDLILAMSEDMKNDLINIGCPDYKVMVHYHGINTAMFNNNSRDYSDVDKFNLISVGTICEKKGQLLVIEALNNLINQRGVKNIHYQIVGSGPYENLARRKVQDYHLSSYVSFCGHVNHGEDLVKQYEQAHIFLHPCMTDAQNSKEGIPGVIVEAMTNGMPVITTRHAGIPSIISHFQNGLLLDEDNVEQIADAIIQLINSAKLRANLGTTARQFALENLDMYAKARFLEKEIYAKLIW